MFAGAGPIIQSAWVVRNFDESRGVWIARGAGPFMVSRRMVIDVAYRGQPAQLDLSVAWGQFDGMQIELVQQHDDGPSAFRDSFPDGPKGGEGSHHHLGMLNSDYDKCFNDCIARGYVAATSGCFNGTRFAHFDTCATFGFMTELTEATEPLLDFYQRVAEAAEGWDGSDPVRQI